MPPIIGSKKTIESQWKAIYKKRLPKRGTSELLRLVDTALGTKTYDAQNFVKTHLGNNAKSDCERFVKGFTDNHAKVERQFRKFKDWTPKEQAFLDQVLKEMKREKTFWATEAKKH